MEAIGKLVGLTSLDIDVIACRPPSYQGWLHFKKLKHLVALKVPCVSDKDLALIVGNTHLTSLNIDYSSCDKLTSGGLCELKKMTTLRSLSLACTDIGDEHMVPIGELASLTELNLNECLELTEDAFPHLAKLEEHSTQVHVKGCEFSFPEAE